MIVICFLKNLYLCVEIYTIYIFGNGSFYKIL